MGERVGKRGPNGCNSWTVTKDMEGGFHIRVTKRHFSFWIICLARRTVLQGSLSCTANQRKVWILGRVVVFQIHFQEEQREEEGRLVESMYTEWVLNLPLGGQSHVGRSSMLE